MAATDQLHFTVRSLGYVIFQSPTHVKTKTRQLEKLAGQKSIFRGVQGFRSLAAGGTYAIIESHQPLASLARVAKLADARDLKSRVPSGTYRFDSDPGHQYGSANP